MKFKAVISDRIYMSDYEYQLFRDMVRKLTYIIAQYKGSRRGNSPISHIELCDVKRIGEIVTIPVGRQDLIPKHYHVIDKRIEIPAEYPTFNGTLRESQQSVVDSIDDNFILNAQVGWGKTFTALALVKKLKQKTLIITHTLFLRDQWISEIRNILGIEPGVIGSGVYNISNTITVANTQTLVKHIYKLPKKFGMVILDECHHTPATSFTNILNALKARYKIGLSGTMTRKDGKHVVIRDYFGMNVVQPKEENVLVPEVHLIETGMPIPGSGRTAWVDRINGLLDNFNYIKLLESLAEIYAAKGHKVLLVSNRLVILDKLQELIPDAGLVTSKTKYREEIIDCVMTGDINILLGSLSIFKEGISINPLSCLIVATPTNNIPQLEQLIGRIMRLYDGKQTPVVVDLVFEGNTGKRHASERLKHYRNRGYKITSYKN